VPSSLAAETTEAGIQRTLILKTFPGFAALSAAQLAVLASITREQLFDEGAVLLTPGMPVKAFYLIVEGRVQALQRGKPTQILGPRTVVGGLAALTGDPEGAHAIALEQTVALEMDGEDLEDVFEEHFSIYEGVLRGIARTFREAQIRVGGGPAVAVETEMAAVDATKPIGLVQRMFLWHRASNFPHGSIEALADMANDAVERRFRAGERLWARGEPAQGSLYVVQGDVECRPAEGSPFVLGAGYYVGGLDAMANLGRWYEAVAKTDIVALWLPQSSLLDVLEDHTELALAMMRNLARGLVAMIDRIAEREAET